MNTPNYNGQRYSQSFNTINENAENEYTQTAYKNASDNFIKTVSSRYKLIYNKIEFPNKIIYLKKAECLMAFISLLFTT